MYCMRKTRRLTVLVFDIEMQHVRSSWRLFEQLALCLVHLNQSDGKPVEGIPDELFWNVTASRSVSRELIRSTGQESYWSSGCALLYFLYTCTRSKIVPLAQNS